MSQLGMHPIEGAAELRRGDGRDSRRSEGTRHPDRGGQRRFQARHRALARGRRQAAARRTIPTQEKQHRPIRGERDHSGAAQHRARAGRRETGAVGFDDRSRKDSHRGGIGRAAVSRNADWRRRHDEQGSAAARSHPIEHPHHWRRRDRPGVRLLLPGLRIAGDDCRT